MRTQENTITKLYQPDCKITRNTFTIIQARIAKARIEFMFAEISRETRFTAVEKMHYKKPQQHITIEVEQNQFKTK